MSSINGRQQVGHGVGGGSASIDNVPFSPGAWMGWIDDDHGFFANGNDAWTCAIYELSTGTITRAVQDPAAPFYGWGMNVGFAGGGTWAAWLADPSIGLFTSDGLHLPNAGLLAVGPNGELGYKPSYQSMGPTVCRERDGSEWTITPGHATDLQLLGNHRAIWQENNQLRVAGLPQPVQLGAVWRPYAFLIGEVWWVTYYSSEGGIVLHPYDALIGITVVPVGIDTWHSARVFGDVVFYALSSGEAEQPGQVRTEAFDTNSVPLVPLTPPPPDVTIPTFTFTHPVIVAPFKDPYGETTAPWEVIVNQTGQTKVRPFVIAEDSMMGPVLGAIEGVYSEASGDPTVALATAEEYHTRLVLAHDSTTDWMLPAGLRPYDVPTLELYLSESEPLDTSVGRWWRQVSALLDQWPGPIGVIPMFYCMGGAPPDELFTVAQVCEGLAHVSDIVNLNARVTLILPFSYLRANGITGHPELRQAFDNLLAEQQRCGLGALAPVEETPEPPDPEPPNPEPPEPEPGPEPEPEPPPEGPDMVFIETKYEKTNASFAVMKFEVIANPDGTESYSSVARMASDDADERANPIYCVTNGGKDEWRPSPGGAFESFRRVGTTLVADRPWDGEENAYVRFCVEVS
jgi:hypothetical protein